MEANQGAAHLQEKLISVIRRAVNPDWTGIHGKTSMRV